MPAPRKFNQSRFTWPLGSLIAVQAFGVVAVMLPTPIMAQRAPRDPYSDDSKARDEATVDNAAKQQDTAAPLRSFERDTLSPAAAPKVTQEHNYGNDATDVEGDAIRLRISQIRRQGPPNEFETYVSEIVDKPLRRFGSNLLVPTARDFTAPPTTTIPADYRLNPGDEVVLGLSGSVDANDLRLVVDTQGRIFIPRVGSVSVAGVAYRDLQALLSRQISRQYRNFNLSIGLGRLRGITVYVTGFAATPGSYTVNGFSTLVNAVLAAGGPSPGGSFRSIQLRRGGKLISDFDLYDLLLRGDKSGDRALQNEDVIFIGPVGPQVAVIGSVNNEAIYEAAPRETVADLLIEAGGINTVADDTRALLLNPLEDTQSGWENLSPAETRVRMVPRAGIIRVLSNAGLVRPRERQSMVVTINGEVAAPGRYFLPPNTKMSDALARAGGLTAGAYPFATVFARESIKIQQRLGFSRALRDLETSLTLEPLTSLLSTTGTQKERADAARAVIEQLRKIEPDGRLVFELPPTAPTLPGDVVLENNDAIFIPPRPTTVGVFGAVPNPSTFYMSAPATIGDYIAKAGGPQKYADRNEIFVVRANGTVLGRRGTRASTASRPALPGDLIFVPVKGNRDKFWAILRELSGALLPLGLTATAIASFSN